MRLPTREYVAHTRETYPKCTRVELVSMNDPYNRTLKPGDKGTVSHVDDMATVFVDWDCGSGLGVVLGEDCIKKI